MVFTSSVARIFSAAISPPNARLPRDVTWTPRNGGKHLKSQCIDRVARLEAGREHGSDHGDDCFDRRLHHQAHPTQRDPLQGVVLG